MPYSLITKSPFVGVPSERQPVKPEEISQGRDSSLAVLVRFVQSNGNWAQIYNVGLGRR